MVFSGCSVTYGTAAAVVTATGMDTEMGRIANLLAGEREGQTPLQKKLAKLRKNPGILALAACAVIFAVGIANGIPVMEIFMTSVSLAVSAIPEGLPAIVTIVLSIGVWRMVKKNALIRRLPAVETPGSASVICSDKTGTLTQNRMKLVKAYLDGDAAEHRNGIFEDISSQNSEGIKKLLQYGTLCCNGTVIFHDTSGQHIGDPTETAIVLAAHKNGMPKDDLNKRYPRLAEIPFDSDRKLMSTVNHMDRKYVVIVKGAVDMIAPRCILGDLDAAKQAADEMSADALRVLAVGYKEIEEIPETLTSEDLENGLTLLGLVGMIDPPRPEAKGAAGMILTDDNFATIVDAVREGRGIYANIKKVVGFLLGTNIGEVITVFTAILLWHKTPLLSMHLLWINLVTDSLPAIALGMEAVESDVMEKKPKPKDEGIFAHGLGVRVVLQGFMFAVLSLTGFIAGENATGALAGGQTLTFMTLSLSQIVQAYNMRSGHSLFKIGPFTNSKLNQACLLSLFLVALVMFTPLRIAFGLVILPPKICLPGLGLSLVPLVTMELSKALGWINNTP